MTKVARWLVAVGLVFALVLAGCGAPAGSEPAKPVTPTPSEKPTTTPTTLTREQQLVEAAKKEGGEVVLWVHTIAEQDAIAQAFQVRYPFLKLRIWNSRGAEIMSKLMEETKAGRHSADVLILSSEIADAYSSGLLEQYEFPNVTGWIGQPKDNFYKSIAGTARVVVYNTDVLPKADAPKSWDDLKNTKWAGKVFLSLSGEDSPLFWSYLWRDGDKLNWDKSIAYWGDVIKNTKPKVVTGYTGAAERLSAGEVAMFPACSASSVLRLMGKGAPLAFAPVGSVPGDAWGIALLKDAPHPNSAKLLIDWLSSDEGLLTYANPTLANIMNPRLFDKSKADSQFKAAGFTWEPLPVEMATSANLKKSSEFWMKALGITG